MTNIKKHSINNLIPKLNLNYVEIKPIELKEELVDEYKKSNIIERPKEIKDIKIKKDYLNKTISHETKQINKLPLLYNYYQLSEIKSVDLNEKEEEIIDENKQTLRNRHEKKEEKEKEKFKIKEITQNLIEKEDIKNNKSLLGENEIIKRKILNEIELPNQINIFELRQIPERIKEKIEEKEEEKEEEEKEEEKEEIKEDKEKEEEKEEKETNKINVTDDITIINNIDFRHTNYLFELKKKPIDEKVNVPKMISYSQKIETIDIIKIDNKIINVEIPKEYKEAKIKSDYINKSRSILKTNLNNLSILDNNYQLCLPEELIEMKKEEEKVSKEEKGKEKEREKGEEKGEEKDDMKQKLTENQEN